MDAARRTLHTGTGLPTDNQQNRPAGLVALDEHVEVRATWGISQRMIAAAPRTRPEERGALAGTSIDPLSHTLPAA